MTEGRITSRSPHEVNEPLLSVCYGAVVATAAANVVLHSNTCTRREKRRQVNREHSMKLAQHTTRSQAQHNRSMSSLLLAEISYTFFWVGGRMVESSVGKMYAGNH